MRIIEYFKENIFNVLQHEFIYHFHFASAFFSSVLTLPFPLVNLTLSSAARLIRETLVLAERL